MKKATSIKNFIKNYIDIDKGEGTGAASRIISNAEKTGAATKINKGAASSITKDSSVNNGAATSNGTTSNIINKDSSTNLMARIIDNTGEEITQLAKQFYEIKTSKQPTTGLSSFFLELQHFQYKLGRPVVYNLFDQLRSWTACESVKVQQDLADYLRFFDLKSKNKRQLRLRNNFLKNHRQLRLVLDYFTLWFNTRKLQCTNQELAALFWWLMEWFESSPVEIKIQLKEFMNIWLIHHNMPSLINKLDHYLILHPIFAKEVCDFICYYSIMLNKEIAGPWILPVPINEIKSSSLQCIQAEAEEEVKHPFRLKGIFKKSSAKGEKRTVRFLHIEKQKRNPLRKEYWLTVKTSLTSLFKRSLSLDYIASEMYYHILLWVEG